MKQITMPEILDLFDKSVHARIKELAQNPRTSHLVLFENQDFCSSRFGAKSLMQIGPDCTYKTLSDVEGHHLNDLPSQRQYPIAFWVSAYFTESKDSSQGA